MTAETKLLVSTFLSLKFWIGTIFCLASAFIFLPVSLYLAFVGKAQGQLMTYTLPVVVVTLCSSVSFFKRLWQTRKENVVRKRHEEPMMIPLPIVFGFALSLLPLVLITGFMSMAFTLEPSECRIIAKHLHDHPLWLFEDRKH